MGKKKAASTPDDDWSATMAAIARTGPIDECVKRMKSIAKVPDDPRLADAIIEWLYSARWPGSGASEGWKAMFKRLVKLGDPRAVAPLRELASHDPPFLGVKHTAWIIEEAAKTAAALEKSAPKTKAAPAIAPKRVGPPPSTLAIVQRVFDAPDDDDVRRVVADALLEQGDPWGELINLQFVIANGKATPDQLKLVEKLITKNAATFCGPISKIAKVATRRFEKGFLSFVRTDAAMVPRRDWEAAATCPHWATVHRVEIDMSTTPKWWVGAWTNHPANRRVRELAFTRYMEPLITLVRASAEAPWRVVEAKELAPVHLRMFGHFADALPDAERAQVEVVAEGPHRGEILELLGR